MVKTLTMHGDTAGAFVLNNASPNAIWNRIDRAPYFGFFKVAAAAMRSALHRTNKNVIYCVMGTQTADMPTNGYGAGDSGFGYMTIYRSRRCWKHMGKNVHD